MSLRRIAFLCTAALLAALPSRVLATSVVPPEFNSLVAQADYVVRGVVKSVSSEWRTSPTGKQYIGSTVEVEVREVIRGNPPTPLILTMVGGKVGDEELTVTGAPKFGVGDENIFFLTAKPNMVSPLIAIMHGLYPIVRDAKTGETYAVRSNGMPLYSETDVALPMEKLSPVKTSNAAAKPLTASAFMGKIRAASNRTPVGTTHAN